MNNKEPEAQNSVEGEVKTEYLVSPAPVDFLFEGNGAIFSDEFQNNEILNEQSKNRRLLYSQLKEVYKNQDEAKEIDQEKLNDFYLNLSKFLKSDVNNARILLYLPFELLPDFNKTQEATDEVKQFKKAFDESFSILMKEPDFRANFIDGDIIEPDNRSSIPDIVVKAMHLVPFLLQKNLINLEEIIEEIRIQDKQYLRKSFGDIVPKLIEYKMITEDQLKEIFGIGFDDLDLLVHKPQKIEIKADSAEELIEFYHREVNKIKSKVDLSTDMNENRKRWIELEAKRGLQQEIANELVKLSNGNLSGELIDLFENLGNDGLMILSMSLCEIVLRGQNGIDLVQKYNSLFEEIYNRGDKAVKDSVQTSYFYFKSKGLLREQVNFIDLPETDFEGNVETNQKLKEEISKFSDVLRFIKIEERCSKNIFPLLVFYGSRVKGYGNHSADLDLALVLKPEADLSLRTQLIEQIKNSLPQGYKSEDIIQFLTEESESGLKIIDDHNEADNSVLDSEALHIFFQGVWFGDSKTLNYLIKNLLPQYLNEDFSSANLPFDRRAERLREIEREVLQYRLLHKGYRRSNPPEEVNKNNPDSDSPFYESGYRRLATLLFLKKVFLPALKTD